MSDILNIGLSGLITYQSALSFTAQNIANVGTPYYTRRQVQIEEALFSGGVNVGDVSRVYSEQASASCRNANALFGMYDQSVQQLTILENLLQDDNNNIGNYLNDTIKAIRDLDANVGSATGRSTYMNKLNILTGQINTVSSQINQQQLNINSSLQTVVTTVNQLTSQIAQINQQLIANIGQDNSSLLDQQEGLVQQLSQYIDFSTQVNSSGQLDILMGNGMALVQGSTATPMTLVNDPANPGYYLVELQSGSYNINLTDFITSGEIAGLYNTQSVLQQTQNSLGQLALGLMGIMNAQNALGIDNYGNLGQNIFTDINSASLTGQRVIPNNGNSGDESMTVNINSVTALTSSDYSLVFDTSSHYILTRLSDNTVVSSGAVTSFPQQVSADGFTININSGTVSAGDSFTISPTQGAANTIGLTIVDPNLFAMGWPVNASASTNNSGTGTVKVSNITDTTNSAFSIPGQLNPPIIIKFLSNSQYELINANTSAVMEGPITYTPNENGFSVFPTPGGYDPGYRISLYGNINAGDTFNINYQSNASGDNRNGLVMEGLLTNPQLQDGSLSFSNAYQLLAGNVSGANSESKIGYNFSDSLVQQAQYTYAQVSGVSIEEEMSNLMTFQQAFAASAQVLSVAKNVFDILSSLGN